MILKLMIFAFLIIKLPLVVVSELESLVNEDRDFTIFLVFMLMFLYVWIVNSFLKNWKLFRSPEYKERRKEKRLAKEKKRVAKRTAAIDPISYTPYEKESSSSSGCCLLAIPLMLIYMPFRVTASLVKRRY